MKTLLAAGGSGGHLMPALALAEQLTAQGKCFILSTARPIDQKLSAASSLVEWSKVNLEPLTPLGRWLSPRWVARQIGAVRRINAEMRRIRPDVVVGFGGYLSAVALAAARRQGIPAVIHEQNFVPGRANRWMARLADAVAVSFAETKEFLSRRARVEVTGNPVRSSLKKVSPQEGRSSFGFDLERPVLLVVGGSQGSRAINNASIEMWKGLSHSLRIRAQILHIAGLSDAPTVREAYRRLRIEARVFSFLHDIEQAYAAADLVLSRAGATSIAEMAALGLPAVLIPYPHAGNHQLHNARWMARIGGAVVLEQKRLTPKILWGELSKLLWNRERLALMREALRNRSMDGSAAGNLAALVREVAA